jgi:hypothetical protein
MFFKELVRNLILKTVMQLDVSCHNKLLARSQENIVFLQQTSHLMKCNFKTLRKYSHRQDSLDIGGPTDLWAFIGRLPHSGMKLIGAVKGLVQDFWHENIRPSSNQKYVLKLRRGSRDREPHIKHFLDITQIKLYEIFKTIHSALNLAQRSFHKCMPCMFE